MYIKQSFKGHMNKLAVHAIGARVVELLFSTFPPKQTSKLKLEFYGPRFTLFNDGNLSNSSYPTIETVLKAQSSGKESALASLLGLINKGIEKNLFSFAYFQQILCEYVTTASPNEVRSLCSSLVDHSIHLLSTRAGSRTVAECAAYGTPKDRKRMMKSLKGYTRSSLLHSDAYIAILRMLDVIDDTVTVQKSVLAELEVLPEKKVVNPLEEKDNEDEDNNKISPLLELALSETASKMFLLLLSKDEDTKKKYLDPLEIEILRPDPTVKEGDEEVPTSKKNRNTRRVELLQYMKSSLVECCINHSTDLLPSRCGGKVLKEVYEAFPSKELADAIVESCDYESNEGESLSMFEDSIGQLCIKSIIQCDILKDEKNAFMTKAIVKKYGRNLLVDIGSSNRGAFVLVALLKSDKTGTVKKELNGQIKDIKNRVKECKKNSKPSAGFEALLNDLMQLSA